MSRLYKCAAQGVIEVMKANFFLQTVRLRARRSMLCAGLGLLSVHLPMSAAAQTVYAMSYTFTTLSGKNANGGASEGTGRARGVDPKGVAVDADGNVYVANFHNQTISRMTLAGDATILAGQPGCIGSADGQGSGARFRYPQAVALDAAGEIYVADTGNNTIRRVSPSGVVTTLAGLARRVGSADGQGSAARFNYPCGVAVDSAGNIYVAELYNSTIRKVTPAGAVTTLAGQTGVFGCADGKGGAAKFDGPISITVDAADDVYVADFFNNAIRKVTATGVVTTLAGQRTYQTGSADGKGSGAQFYHPCGLTVDSTGNVYVADTENQTIRQVTPDGTVVTLAGLAGQTGNADGAGREARFNHPFSITTDPAGNLYVADLGNAAIRKGVPAIPGRETLFTSVGR